LQIWSLNGDPKTLHTSGSPIHCMDWFCKKEEKEKFTSWIACGAKDSMVGIWNLDHDNPKSTYLMGHASAVMSIAFSPDGKYLASVEERGCLIIWSTKVLGSQHSLFRVQFKFPVFVALEISLSMQFAEVFLPKLLGLGTWQSSVGCCLYWT
jgi:WD40 repeat protein